MVRREQLGTPIDAFDAQIAAIGATRAAPIATRNVADFRDTGIGDSSALRSAHLDAAP